MATQPNQATIPLTSQTKVTLTLTLTLTLNPNPNLNPTKP